MPAAAATNRGRGGEAVEAPANMADTIMMGDSSDYARGLVNALTGRAKQLQDATVWESPEGLQKAVQKALTKLKVTEDADRIDILKVAKDQEIKALRAKLDKASAATEKLIKAREELDEVLAVTVFDWEDNKRTQALNSCRVMAARLRGDERNTGSIKFYRRRLTDLETAFSDLITVCVWVCRVHGRYDIVITQLPIYLDA